MENISVEEQLHGSRFAVERSQQLRFVNDHKLISRQRVDLLAKTRRALCEADELIGVEQIEPMSVWVRRPEQSSFSGLARPSKKKRMLRPLR
jgi:hypothetical protein